MQRFLLHTHPLTPKVHTLEDKDIFVAVYLFGSPPPRSVFLEATLWH